MTSHDFPGLPTPVPLGRWAQVGSSALVHGPTEISKSAHRWTPDTVEAVEAQETTLQLLRWQFLILRRLWNHVDSVDSVEGPWRVCPKIVRNIEVWRQHVLRALKSSQTGNGGRDLACGDCISASSTCLQW